MKIKIKKLTNTAKIPTLGSEGAAGYDLYADKSCIIKPHSMEKIETNISMKIPNGYFGAIYARSGLATKNGLRPANCVGIIDSDYVGNIIVALYNDSDVFQEIHQGDRIAQLIIQPYLRIEFNEVDKLDETERGDKGFGHSGK